MLGFEKTAIVLLPGMDGTGELLAPLAKRLSTYRPVHLVNYPADRFMNYEQLVSYVSDRLPDDRFVILGESFSGPIAIEIAAAHRRCAGLILAASFARHPLPRLLAAFSGLLDLKWMPSRVVVAALMGSAATPEIGQRLRQVLAELPRDIIRARAREVLQVDKRRRLSEITCPMLCLHGRSDRLVGKRYVEEIVAARPGCQVRWLDSSHMLLATDAGAAAVVIEEFCGQQDR